jgi:hypothetical protein
MIVVYENYTEHQFGIYNDERIKSIIDRVGTSIGAPCFLYAALRI